jgi:hypothetical protein
MPKTAANNGRILRVTSLIAASNASLTRRPISLLRSKPAARRIAKQVSPSRTRTKPKTNLY